MRGLITDVTEMHQGNYCVACWLSSNARMVRPLPSGMNWTAGILVTYGVSPGSIIDFQASGARPTGVYPHLTEDMPIDAGTIKLVSTGHGRWFDTLPVARSVSTAFGEFVRTTGEWNGARKGAYVPEGTQIGSLAAVRATFDHVEFFEDDYRGTKSLRAYLEDADQRYTLPVVAKIQREMYRAHGVGAINQSLPRQDFLHVRVGLARAWAGQPGRCTVMINGVYW